jgi:hypothetical protein
MIVYGTKTTLLKSEITWDQCPSCGKANCIQMNVFQRYVHLFWIPFLPAGKTGVSQCTNCRQVLQLKQMPPALKLSYDNLKTDTKTPLWNFIGIVLIGIALVGFSIQSKNKAERVSKMVLAPKAGDIFEIKLKEDAYTLFKVSKVAGDTVYVADNKYQTNQESGLNDLKNKEYETVVHSITIAELVAMDKKDEILDIDRQ